MAMVLFVVYSARQHEKHAKAEATSAADISAVSTSSSGTSGTKDTGRRGSSFGRSSTKQGPTSQLMRVLSRGQSKVSPEERALREPRTANQLAAELETNKVANYKEPEWALGEEGLDHLRGKVPAHYP